MIEAFFARFAARFVATRIGGFLSKIPGWVWIVLAAAAVLGLGLHLHSNAEKAAYKAAYSQGVNDTKAAFAAAQAKADAAQRARNVKTVAKQSTISRKSTDALTHTYDSIDARARAISLRHEAAARDSAPGSGVGSATGNAAAGACPAPAEDGLPWSVAFPLMVQAQRNLAQLNAILDWEDAQTKLDAKTREPDPSQPQEQPTHD